MKSFRLYRRPFVPPERVVSEYSPEELADFWAAFQPLADRCRRCVRILLGLMALGWACVLSNVVLPKSCLPWSVCGFLACILAMLFVDTILGPELICPACHNFLDKKTFGPYCPECGAKGLEPVGWFCQASCSSCGRRFRRGKGRGIRIRACTHCGVWLDERGV